MNCILKIFLSILMFGPVLVVTILLTVLALIANCFTLIYFILFGWFCEVKICQDACHGPFIADTLYTPWTLLIKFCEKISNFLCEKSRQNNTYGGNPVIIQNTTSNSNNF